MPDLNANDIDAVADHRRDRTLDGVEVEGIEV